MSGGKGGGSHTTTQQVTVPSFLKPLVNQATGTAGNALGNLSGMLPAGSSTVAGFNSAQTQGQQSALDFAGGAGGFLPTAQDALMSTARGDFLYGGPGFNEAVNASLRAAQPGILSSFGAAGRGTGGLAQSAIQRAASDAFAGLFNNERQRQMSAAAALPEMGLMGANIMQQVGGIQQQQQQRENEGPLEAQMRLLQAATGTINPQSLFGQQTTQPIYNNPLGQALGFGLGAVGIGQGLFGPAGLLAGGMSGAGMGLPLLGGLSRLY